MKLTQIIASATVAAVLGSAGYAVAGATSGASTAPSTAAAITTKANGTAKPNATTKRARRRRVIAGALNVAAGAIGITRPALVQELRGGKTIAEVATEHGTTAQSVIDAIDKAATAKIEAAQTAGKITPARATKLENRLATIVPKFVNTWHVPAHAA